LFSITPGWFEPAKRKLATNWPRPRIKRSSSLRRIRAPGALPCHNRARALRPAIRRYQLQLGSVAELPDAARTSVVRPRVAAGDEARELANRSMSNLIASLG